tara:strand:- start:35 stop:1906 length:1872 start_codon:yes stop_codon:yes gene_type:complete
MMPGMEEEEDPMADQYQEGNQLSAMTGMPDMGNLSIGAATGTMPQPGGTLMTGEPMERAWSTLMKEDDDVPDMSNFGAPYDPDTRIPDLSMDDLYRLLQHPNSRIRHKANEEMQMRSMDAEGSNLPFDENTTPAGEVAAFYEPQFQDLNFQYGNQQPPDLEDGEYNEEGYDEHYSQERAGDVLEAMPGDIEFFPSLAAKYEHLKNTAPPDVVESYRNRIKDFFDKYTQPSEIFGTTLPPQFTPELPKGTLYAPEEIMQQSDKINEALNIYPGGNKAYTGFTDNFQNKKASEPMEHAWSSLLKEEGEEEEEEEEDAVPDNKFNRKPPPLDLDAEVTRYRKLADKNVVVPNESALARNEFPPTAHGNPDYFTQSEPMEHAWSSLMKSRLDRAGRSKDKSWKQPMYEIAAGGSQQETATPRRAKMQSRYMQAAKKHGLDKSPLSVHRTHLGIATKQPQRLFPRDYGQQMGTQARRKLMGNVPQIPAGHAMGPETSYSPRVPKVGNAAGLPIKEPRAPAMRGGALAKSDSLEDIRKDLNQINKKMSEYMHFAQIRRLLRRLKDAAERQESRLKAAASSEPGQNREAGHREGNKTTKPEGGTENLEDDPKNWGAPSTLFAARGSGRTA